MTRWLTITLAVSVSVVLLLLVTGDFMAVSAWLSTSLWQLVLLLTVSSACVGTTVRCIVRTPSLWFERSVRVRLYALATRS